MRIAGTVSESIVDGPGLRLTVFTQGCPHRCPGCHNPQTHDPAGGREESTAALLARYAANPLLDGLTLSGGELQRTFLAQVFAQNPKLLILDEPANHLDLIYQKHIFSLIEAWLKQPGRAVISVVHDLSLAKKYGTHAVLMDRGRCAAQGKTDEVMTRERLEAVYGMDVYGWMRDLLGQWA